MGTLTSRPMAIDYYTGSPSPVRDVSYSITGTKGSTTYFYWVVANYSWGSVAPIAPLIVANAPDILGGGNAVVLSWLPPSVQIVSYAVLRTTTPTFPGTSTTAIATALTTTTVTDSGAALVAYTFTAIAAMRAVMYIDGTGPVPILVSNVGQQVNGDISTSGSINLTNPSATVNLPGGGSFIGWRSFTVELLATGGSWRISSPGIPDVLVPTAAALTQDIVLGTLAAKTYVQAFRIVTLAGPPSGVTGLVLSRIGNVFDATTNPNGSDSFWVFQNIQLTIPPGVIGFTDPIMSSLGNTSLAAVGLSITINTTSGNLNAIVPPLKFNVDILSNITP